MIVEGIRISKEEKDGIDLVFPDSPAAKVLAKMLVQMEASATVELKSPGSNLEQVRYEQGYLAAIDEIWRKIKKISAAHWSDVEEQEEDGENEEVIDVDF